MFTESDVLDFAKNNLNKILDQMGPTSKGAFVGAATEIMAAEEAGSKHEDGIGYDYTHPNPKYGKVEVKSTSVIQKTKTFRVQSLASKRNKCHYFQIHDLHFGRVFMVPHDILFNDMVLYEGDDELRWSASYNKIDGKRPIQPLNTKILEDHEITHDFN